MSRGPNCQRYATGGTADSGRADGPDLTALAQGVLALPLDRRRLVAHVAGHLHGAEADLLEKAVEKVLADGVRTADLMGPEGGTPVSTSQMGDKIVEALSAL